MKPLTLGGEHPFQIKKIISPACLNSKKTNSLSSLYECSLPVISMTSYVHLRPSGHISTRNRAISGDISPNLYHMTPRPYLCFSVSSVHSDYNMLCSTLVLVPLCRYLRAVCTAPAFIPLVRRSGYCTFHLPSYSSPLLIHFHLHI